MKNNIRTLDLKLGSSGKGCRKAQLRHGILAKVQARGISTRSIYSVLESFLNDAGVGYRRPFYFKFEAL